MARFTSLSVVGLLIFANGPTHAGVWESGLLSGIVGAAISGFQTVENEAQADHISRIGKGAAQGALAGFALGILTTRTRWYDLSIGERAASCAGFVYLIVQSVRGARWIWHRYRDDAAPLFNAVNRDLNAARDHTQAYANNAIQYARDWWNNPAPAADNAHPAADADAHAAQ